MRASEFSNTKLVIFDIDDTLVNTDTKVGVVRDGQIVKKLNSHDFTHYKLQPGESFDFGDFANAQEFFDNARPIVPMIGQLKRDIATGNKVIMVTARADFDNREVFLDTFRKYGVDIDKVHVYRAGNIGLKVPTEEKKKMIIRTVMGQDHYDKVIMYDDAEPNLHAFMSLAPEYPWSKFYAWHVDRDGRATEYHRSRITEDPAADKIELAALDFYKNQVGDVGAQPVDDFGAQARELLQKATPGIRGKVLAALKKANANPYIQGGVITTVGSLLAGGVLASAQKMGLNPGQTNMLLQAILNTVIPTMVSRVNGKSWRDTLKYTLASAGIGTGIAAITEDSEPSAAGCILYAEDTGRWGLQQRSDTVGDPGVWAAWGGGREPGETLEQTVRRELAEESGYRGPIELEPLARNAKYVTYIGIVPKEFEPRPNPEWQDFAWVELGHWPQPLHPGVAAALQNIYIKENFADGKVRGKSRPGRVKRAGASCKGSVSDLRAKARKYGGEKGKMYHWCANMKGGKKK